MHPTFGLLPLNLSRSTWISWLIHHNGTWWCTNIRVCWQKSWRKPRFPSRKHPFHHHHFQRRSLSEMSLKILNETKISSQKSDFSKKYISLMFLIFKCLRRVFFPQNAVKDIFCSRNIVINFDLIKKIVIERTLQGLVRVCFVTTWSISFSKVSGGKRYLKDWWINAHQDLKRTQFIFLFGSRIILWNN